MHCTGLSVHHSSRTKYCNCNDKCVFSVPYVPARNVSVRAHVTILLAVVRSVLIAAYDDDDDE